MDEVTASFEKAVEESKQIKEKPSNETLLQLYSLYKQATEGDVNVPAPGNPFDFVAKAKYEAWGALKGKSVQEAQVEYIKVIEKLKS